MAQLAVKFSGDESDIIRSYNKVVAQNERLEKKIKDVARASRQANREAKAAPRGAKMAQSSMIGQVATQLGGLATGLVSVSKAIELVNTSAAKLKEMRKESVTSFKSLEDVTRELNQVSDTTEEFEFRLGKMNTVAKARGINITEAGQMLFDAISLQLEDEFSKMAEANPIFSTKALVPAAGTMKKAFGLEAMETLNMFLAGSDASLISSEEFGEQAKVAAMGASKQGTDPAYLFAALANMSNELGNPAKAANFLSSFNVAASLHPDLAGKGTRGAYEAVHAMSEEDRAKFLGSGETLNLSYAYLDKYAEKNATLAADIQRQKELTGTGESLRSQKMNQMYADTRGGRDRKLAADLKRAEVNAEVVKTADLAASSMESQMKLVKLETAELEKYGPAGAANRAAFRELVNGPLVNWMMTGNAERNFGTELTAGSFRDQWNAGVGVGRLAPRLHPLSSLYSMGSNALNPPTRTAEQDIELKTQTSLLRTIARALSPGSQPVTVTQPTMGPHEDK